MGGAESRRQLPHGAAQVVVCSLFRRDFRPSRNWPDPGPSVCRPAAPRRFHTLCPGTRGELRRQRKQPGNARNETLEFSRHLAASAMDGGKRPASPAFLVVIEYLAEGCH